MATGETMRTGLPLSIVRWIPLVVVYSLVVAMPALIGMRWTGLPSCRTTIWCVRVSTVLIMARPTVKATLRSAEPYVAGRRGPRRDGR